MPNSKARFAVLSIIMVIMFGAIAYKLFDLQIIKGEEYLEVATERLTSNIVEKAPRGEIMDRYGTALVTNEVGYSVVMQKTDLSDDEFNRVIKLLIDILYETGCEYYDELPISFSPYQFEFKDENGDGSVEDEKAAWFEGNVYNGKEINGSMSAQEVINAYKKLYKLDESFLEDEQRRIIGIRSTAAQHGFSSVTSYIAADDVNVDAVTRIKEEKDSLKGISITNDYIRKYTKPGLATHILGRTGKISAEEYEEHKEEGYGYNDIFGKQGIEKWAESYLRGTDGTSGSFKKINGKEISVADDTDPVPGNYVVLTIDSELQQAAEKSLENNINMIRAQGGSGEKDGHDCNAGAAVVVDIKTGDVLAAASYPTYDMSTFNEDYSELLENDANPMWNRCVSGLYSPGSTFKPLVAIAGVQAGVIGINDQIEDEGVYKYYADYQPACWIWTEYQTTHGKQNLTQAIENSCNFYFYEVGRRLGIENINEYARKFGLGESTGIELSEETSGHMASPEYKKEIIKNVTSRDWYGGDTLQAAIGQSYSLFTPVQLANYTAALANGGTRYKLNLIKSIRSSVDGSVIKEFQPEVVENIGMSGELLNAVKDGMKKVVDEGSAADIFQNYAVPVGGKTGTAQLGNGSNNAIFIAYAPFDDPQIAVAVVLEHGVRGSNAGYVAKDIFDKYFKLDGTQATAAPQTGEEIVAAEQTPEASPESSADLLR